MIEPRVSETQSSLPCGPLSPCVKQQTIRLDFYKPRYHIVYLVEHFLH